MAAFVSTRAQVWLEPSLLSMMLKHMKKWKHMFLMSMILSWIAQKKSKSYEGSQRLPWGDWKFLKALPWFLVPQQKTWCDNLLTGILMALLLGHFFKLGIYSLPHLFMKAFWAANFTEEWRVIPLPQRLLCARGFYTCCCKKQHIMHLGNE